MYRLIILLNKIIGKYHWILQTYRFLIVCFTQYCIKFTIFMCKKPQFLTFLISLSKILLKFVNFMKTQLFYPSFLDINLAVWICIVIVLILILKIAFFTPKNLVKSVGQNRTILGIILSKKIAKKTLEIKLKILLIFAKKIGLFF